MQVARSLMNTGFTVVRPLLEAHLSECIFYFFALASFENPDCIFASKSAFHSQKVEKQVFMG